MRRVNYPVIVVLPFFLLACAASQQAEKKAGTKPSLKSLPHTFEIPPGDKHLNFIMERLEGK